MKILIDFFPILLFFGAYKFFNIYVATGVLMAATVAQMGLIYAIDRRLQTMHKITLGLILMFGVLTLVLQDDRFIKWKTTVLYGAMALIMAVSVGIMKKNVAHLLFGKQLTLPEHVWMRLNQACIVYCIFMSALNAYVVLNFSTEFWVGFKLWGFALPLVFMLGIGLYITPHLSSEDSPEEKE